MSAIKHTTKVVSGSVLQTERHTKFVSWVDPDRGLESMKGPAWTAALKEEAAIAKKYVDQVDPRHYASSITSRPHISYSVNGIIDVTVENAYFKSWKGAMKNAVSARDVLLSPDLGSVLSVEEEGHGAESFTLHVYNVASGSERWALKDVGETVACIGGRVYYTAIKNRLWNWAIMSARLSDGGDVRIVIQSAVPSENCAIEREADGVVYGSIEDAQDFKYYRLGGSRPVQVPSPRQIPAAWKAPHGSYGVEFVWPSKGLLVTKSHGQKTLWHCSPTAEAKKLHEIPAGKIIIDPYIFHGPITTPIKSIPIVILRPDMKLTHYRIIYNKFGIAQFSKVNGGGSNGLVCSRHVATSLDGTAVHYIIVCSRKGRASRLMATGYGAYNLESSTAMIKERWGPLLENGWAVAVGFIRGGGDHDEAWGKAGRRSGRLKTFQDMEAVIRSAQRSCGIGPQHTCIYGRSAGGYLVGGLLGRNPEGGLFRGVYTEVPYVDVLETTTNPGLPLTRIEYGEFGNPAANLGDLMTVGLTSPAVSAAVIATPSIFVVARTALNDSQVYAYEAVKWVRRLRSGVCGANSAPKILLVENGQGHFTPPDNEVSQHSIDAALIDFLSD